MAQPVIEELKTLNRYLEDFRVFFRSPKGQEFHKKERLDRIAYFRNLLAEHHIDHLTEEEARHLVSSLWASGFWKNKEYHENKVFSDNGLDRLKRNLKDVLYGPGNLDERWDRFRENVKGIGPAALSEILCFMFPDRYGLWNQKPINVLPFLGFMSEGEIRKITQRQTSGKDYLRVNEVLGGLRDYLKEHGFPDADLVVADFFLWRIFATSPEFQDFRKAKNEGREVEIVKPTTTQREQGALLTSLPSLESLTHSDIQGLLLELGSMLGYDTYVADPASSYRGQRLADLASLEEVPQFTLQRLVETVRYIDVIWFKNEFPEVCFEVEHTTGVTQGLLRLYQVRQLTYAKFFIIAPAEVKGKFEREISKDPFHLIKERYLFRSYEDLMRLYKSAGAYFELKERFFNSQG